MAARNVTSRALRRQRVEDERQSDRAGATLAALAADVKASSVGEGLVLL